MDRISVIICCHNSDKDILQKVIDSLKCQTLILQEWELIIVDNKSDIPIKQQIDISWHPDALIVEEPQLGLVHARIKGTLTAKYEIIATVDDDTPLFNDYLENVLAIYSKNPDLGVVGGKTVPQFETKPPEWLDDFKGLLAIRDLGDQPIIASLKNAVLKSYPECAPLLIAPRKKCMMAYIDHYNKNISARQLGRKGNDLSSGEDNDINLFIYKSGYSLGYFPNLRFIHIIPKKRYSLPYLKRMAYESNRSWIKVLDIHQINSHHKIPAWTVPFRQIKAWFKLKAWKNEVNCIKWEGACGKFRGLSEI